MDRFNGFLRRESAKKAFDVTVETVAESNMTGQCRQWKPITLRRPFLFAVILVTLGLLALVQFLVVYDQQNDGILFAPKISELGAGHIFLYRYFPTILSVSYGLIWHWIDVDTRRIEPYRQLSKPGGATGHDSLHLHYPTDLLAFVPLNALKRKHWPVVISSSALVLIGMGLTPLQAAMFATQSVTRTFDEQMQVSQQYLSLADQSAQVTANYTYSVANIVWLEERLPPFMTREAAFMPFKPVDGQGPHENELWTAETTSFSVDVKCESPIPNDLEEVWTSSQGCQVGYTYGLDGTDVIGVDRSGNEVKEYSPFFAGFDGGGSVNYYLSSSCPKEASNVFMVGLQKNKKSADDPPGPMTKLFCETAYYQQKATATVHQVEGNVTEAIYHVERAPLPPTIFNTSIFQEQISSGQQQERLRGAIPAYSWPDQKPQLSKLPITLDGSYVEMANIFGLAVGANPRDVGDYMDPEVLADTFQAAHRLLFARAMVDVLDTGYEETTQTGGTRAYKTEAVRIVPHFAYAVEAILGAAALMTFALMAVSWSDQINLATDPGSLSSLMCLVKGRTGLLEQFSKHDQSSWSLLEASTSDSKYALERPFGTSEGTLELREVSPGTASLSRLSIDEDKPDFKYPIEFSKVVGSLFVLALIAALAAISYLYKSAQSHGLALPSENRFIRQILQNYIPTIIATLIEPLWIVLNRLLCFFQPFEELYGREVSAQRSINLRYSSLPPQFVIFKALRAKHFTLGAVCAMALLANVLAVAFSGLLNEQTTSVPHEANATSLYNPRLRTHIENATETDNPYPFYHIMANFTSDTPIPKWTGDSAFYLPVSYEAQLNKSNHLQLNNVNALASNLECDHVGQRLGSSWSLSGQSLGENSTSLDWTRRANLTLSLPNDNGDPFVCANRTVYMSHDFDSWPCSSQQIMAFEYLASLSVNSGKNTTESDPCHGLFLGLWARKSAASMCKDDGGSFDFAQDDALVMLCKPKVVTQSANITVTGDQYVLDKRGEGPPSEFSGSAKLIEEANIALWSTTVAGAISGGTWHNDSFPSDWHSYVMDLMDPDAGTLDPKSPLPGFDETADLFTKAFQQVFAIWLGIDYERLLAQAKEGDYLMSATVIRPEIRIVVSRPMVILSSIILGLYIIVAIVVYMHRPGRFLPRMPLTMASDIALFAASKAVGEPTDADQTRHDLGGERERFGYGRFIGTDGKPHVGIEKVPFVVPV